ncbi:putative uncharacterized protein [Parabacteroides johnsonii CAG:246]|nr:putative uncharacterized protein [Parabacteroides johnsonii CAG:246]
MYLSYHTDVAFSASSGNKSITPVKDIRWSVSGRKDSRGSVSGMTILNGPQYRNRSVILYTPLHLIPNDNLKELMIVWPC